jgi:FAD-dependent oxidoreductase domain-containing protein 1
MVTPVTAKPSLGNAASEANFGQMSMQCLALEDGCGLGHCHCMRKFDVVIVGGAVVGSATAHYLKKLGYTGSVAIVEMDVSFRQSCTSLSLGGLRQQFSTPENIALSMFGLQLVRNLKQEFGPDADVGFKEQGYLILASAEGLSVLEDNHATQISCGADNVMLDAAALKARFPHLNTQGVAAGCFGQSGEGWLDPYSLMGLFRTSALTKGVELITARVTGLASDGTQVTGVTLESGETIGCGTLVNAAGAGAGALAAMAGIALPVGPRKRYVYVLDCPDAPPSLHQGPLTTDWSGVYMRPEGRTFLCGNSPEEADEPPVDWEMDHSWFETHLWEPLATRIPAFEALKVVGSWVGHYDYNALDQNGIFGRHPVISNFIFANGFSGHGIQQGPATGLLTAEQIMFGTYRSIEVKRLDYARIAKGELLFEKNVI